MTYPLLDSIHFPHDIATWDIERLEELSVEARKRIIEVLSVNGGHLASNLGAVELTIALHKVFKAPKDKIVFDTSHQTYTHKLLTGRHPLFHTIRKYKGLCGFAHPFESSYDSFYAGHAGTALSLALGLAKARDLQREDHHVVSVIGDATLTCGMVLEAFNNVPKDLSKFMIVLNDNAMSISDNVGHIKHILSRILCNPTLHKLYNECEHLVSKVPGYGPRLAKQGSRVAGSIKNLVSPAAFFEQYGVTYIGPIEGHDLRKLIAAFEALKADTGPVLVHVLTVKGKGMPEAMNNPISHHGAKPFDKDSGKFLPTPFEKPSFPKVFGEHILQMAKENPHLVALTPAMSYGSCLDGLRHWAPDRCLDVGIAEGHCVTFAGGMAKDRRLQVLVSIYSTFLQRALDNLFHDVCLQEIPVVFAIDRAGLSPADGPTHHGIYDIGFLKEMPNMVIAQPRDGQLLKELLSSCFDYQRPTALRYPNLATVFDPKPLKKRPLGKGEILADGEDLMIIALGHMCEIALKTRDLLCLEGLEATVVDPIFIKPLDEALFEKLLLKHTKIVTLEEHSLQGGLGNTIQSWLFERGLHKQVELLSLGIPDKFVQQGSHKELLEELGLTAECVANKIYETFVPECVK